MVFKMKTWSGYQNSPIKQEDELTTAKNLVKENVANTTVDSGVSEYSGEAEENIMKAIEILRNLGYSEEEIEQNTGAGGYEAAMNWAIGAMKRDPNEPVDPDAPGIPGTEGYEPSVTTYEKNTSDSSSGTTELVLIRATDITDPKTGKVHPTENMYGDERGFIPLIKGDDGIYYVTTKDGEKVAISPTDESVVPRSLLENVELGPDMQKVISEYKANK